MQDRIRDRVQRVAFGPGDTLNLPAASDDDFERSTLPLATTFPARQHISGNRAGAWVQSLAALLAPARFGRLAGGIALVLLIGLLAGLLNPVWLGALVAGMLAATSSPATTDPMLVAGPLAAFDGWRIAYVGDDGRLYVVTSDGRTTLAGPQLPDLLSSGGSPMASASPDGHRIAYATRTSGLAIMDLTGAPAKPIPLPVPAAGTDFSWSPDGSRLAMTRVDGSLATVDAATGHLAPVAAPAIPASLADLGGQSLIGWRDATHLLVARREWASATTRVELVDVQTGRTRPLAALSLPGPAPRFALSSDGAKLLAYSPIMGSPPASDPSQVSLDGIAAIWVVDCANGSARQLTEAAHALDGPPGAAVWNGDDSSLYVATRFAPSSRSTQSATYHVWILSTAGDYALKQSFFGMPLEWMPGAGTLVFGIRDPAAPGMTRFDRLWALTYTLRGPTTHRLINGATEHLSFLGFMRTT